MILHEEKIQDDVVSQVICEVTLDTSNLLDRYTGKSRDHRAPLKNAETFEKLTGKPYPDTIEKYFHYIDEKYKKATGKDYMWNDMMPGTYCRVEDEYRVDDDGRIPVKTSTGVIYMSYYKTDVQIYLMDIGEIWWSDEDKAIKVRGSYHIWDVLPGIPCKDIYDYNIFKKAMDKAMRALGFPGSEKQ
jgi:hypothetical protein